MKRERRKARGIRFTEALWSAVKARAKKEKVYPSDIVRYAVDKYISSKKR